MTWATVMTALAAVMQSSVTMTFDWGVIVTAVMQAVIVLVPASIGMWKLLKQGKATHVLVNDQLTREKSTRLLDAQASRELLEVTMIGAGKSLTANQRALLAAFDAQIAGLAAEVRQRDIAAGTLVRDRPDEPSRRKRSSDGTMEDRR